MASVLLLLAGTASGQSIWQNDLGGLWSTGENWSTGMPPASMGTAIFPDLGMPYSVTIDASPSLATLSIDIANAALALQQGSVLSMNSTGGIVNEGTLTINDTGVNAITRLQTAVNSSITGAGTVRLNQISGSVLTAELQANSGTTLTIGANQTIAGRGLVDAVGTIFMNGTFDADVPGGDLLLDGVIDMTGGGIARGTAGFVNIGTGASIIGGQLTGGVHITAGRVGGGLLMTGNNAQRNGAIGQLDAGGIVNDGTLTINDTGVNASTRLQTAVDSSITGTGTVRLNQISGSAITAELQANSGTTLTIGANQTIAGRGLVDAVGTIFMNGTFDADVPGGDLLLDGVIDMTGGGIARGTAGFVNIGAGASIIGGQLTGGVHITAGRVGGGLLMTGNNAQRNGAIGQLDAGGIVNDGTLTINDTGVNASTRLQTAVDSSITGTGTVRLNQISGSAITAELQANSGTTLTIGVNQTIAGRGLVDAVGTIFMNGTLDADVPGGDLVLDGVIDMTGGGIARGTAGFVNIGAGASIIGGQLTGGVHITAGGVGGGLLMTGNNAQRNGFTGLLDAGGIVNDGTLTINDTGTNAITRLQTAVDSSITGTGTVRLNQISGSAITAELRISTGTTLTIGPDQTIAGRGNIDSDGALDLLGTLSPGVDNAMPETISLQGAMTLGNTSRLEFDFVSASSFDRLNGNNASMALDGTIELRLPTGYVPVLGERFLILDAAALSGWFDSIVTPQVGLRYFKLVQTGGNIEAVWTCRGDANVDGVLSPADFSAWIAAYNAQSSECDQNNDGQCTPADFSAWIANFNAGCL